jgi:hypothetical protein
VQLLDVVHATCIVCWFGGKILLALHVQMHCCNLAVNLFEVLVLVVAEFDDSLFDFVEVLFVFVVHRARFVDLFAEEDKVVLYPLGVLKLWRCCQSRIV